MYCWIRVFVFFVVIFSTDAQRAKCVASTRDYDCMANLSDVYTIHWTLEGDNLRLAMDVETLGWCGFCFAGRPLNMAPADSVIGWIDYIGIVLRPYYIVTKFVDPEDQDFNVQLVNVTGEERDGRTVIEYTRDINEGTFPVDPNAETPVNFAYGNIDRLDYHFDRGSAVIRFADLPEGVEPDEKEVVPDMPKTPPTPEPETQEEKEDSAIDYDESAGAGAIGSLPETDAEDKTVDSLENLD